MISDALPRSILAYILNYSIYFIVYIFDNVMVLNHLILLCQHDYYLCCTSSISCRWLVIRATDGAGGGQTSWIGD
jgi:hypothetical protein